MNKFFIHLLLFLCLQSTLLQAQSFTTRATSTVAGKKDVLAVEYVADDVSVDQFRLPKFSNWILVTGPDISSTNIVSGNVLKRQVTFSIMLQPKALGKQVIPGATALINNKPRTSNPVVVEVKNVDHIAGANNPAQQPPQPSLLDLLPLQDELPAGQYLKKGEKAIDKIRSNILVKLDVSKRSCYAGEPILATYKLCTRLRSKSKVVKQPMFSGCTVVELTDNEMTSHIEKVNGVDYNVFVIRKVQLIPLNAGSLVLPAATVENTVSFYDASQINYRDLFYDKSRVPAEEQTVTLQNKLETIEVKELPPFPSNPAVFSGAIGTFDINISAGDGKLTTTGNNSLTLTIHGVGNLQNVKAPNIAWPEGIEGFEPGERIDYDKSVYPIIVAKTFTYPFVADKKGTYIIPAVQFNFFDANTGQYRDKATTPFALQIGQGSKNIFKTNSLTNVSVVENPLYIIIGAAMLTLLVAVFWFNARKKARPQPAATKTVQTHAEVTKSAGDEYLFKIRELEPVSSGSVFYTELCKYLRSFIKAKYNIDSYQLPGYIQQHPAKATTLLQLKELIDKCNLAMYTPIFDVEESMQHRLKAIEVIMKLENE